MFIIQLIGFIALSYVGIKGIIAKKTNPPNTDGSMNDDEIFNSILDTKNIVLLVITGIFGFFLSLIYMFLMQKFPKPLIKITLYLSIAAYFVAAVVYGYIGQYLLVREIFKFKIFLIFDKTNKFLLLGGSFCDFWSNLFDLCFHMAR